jgi:hypothetical protein
MKEHTVLWFYPQKNQFSHPLSLSLTISPTPPTHHYNRSSPPPTTVSGGYEAPSSTTSFIWSADPNHHQPPQSSASVARHIYCLWHILKRILDKFKSYSNYCAIKNAIHKYVYESQTCSDFEVGWQSLLDSYKLNDHDWLCRLYNKWTF